MGYYPVLKRVAQNDNVNKPQKNYWELLGTPTDCCHLCGEECYLIRFIYFYN